MVFSKVVYRKKILVIIIVLVPTTPFDNAWWVILWDKFIIMIV